MQNHRRVQPQRRKSAPRRAMVKRGGRTRKKLHMPVLRNGKTLLWLFLFFPVGFTKMWKSSCTWKNSVKYIVSAVPALALAFLLIWPFGVAPAKGGVNLVGTEKVAEVYGPELPEKMVEGYSRPVEGSVLTEDSTAEDNTIYVYATDKQTRYHLGTCKFAYASGRRMTLYEANFRGLTPCQLCKAPEYQPESDAEQTN